MTVWCIFHFKREQYSSVYWNLRGIFPLQTDAEEALREYLKPLPPQNPKDWKITPVTMGIIFAEEWVVGEIQR